MDVMQVVTYLWGCYGFDLSLTCHVVDRGKNMILHDHARSWGLQEIVGTTTNVVHGFWAWWRPWEISSQVRKVGVWVQIGVAKPGEKVYTVFLAGGNAWLHLGWALEAPSDHWQRVVASRFWEWVHCQLQAQMQDCVCRCWEPLWKWGYPCWPLHPRRIVFKSCWVMHECKSGV